jgi:predicted DCC family thiol-disulfide oxidoreductase YuxK
MNNLKNNIVFYDGECGFCNSSVQFVLKNKKKHNLHFAALQSEFAENVLKTHHIEIKFDTLYFLTNNKVYSKSSGALVLSKQLKFPYSLLQVLIVVPKFIRDYFYDLIAKRRHKLRSGHCVIPSKTDKSLFITD